MFITHHFRENSMSWSNNYVKVFGSYSEAEKEMRDSIYYTLTHCEKETMDKIVELLKDFDRKNRSYDEDKYWVVEIDWFKIDNSAGYYYITDKLEEDVYKFKILDVGWWDYASDF